MDDKQKSCIKVRELKVRLQNVRREKSQTKEAQKRRIAKLEEEIAEKKDEINKVEREADGIQHNVERLRQDMHFFVVELQRKKRDNDNRQRRLDGENRRLQDMKEQLKNEQDQNREKRQKQCDEKNRRRLASASPSPNRMDFQNRNETRIRNQGKEVQFSNTNRNMSDNTNTNENVQCSSVEQRKSRRGCRRNGPNETETADKPKQVEHSAPPNTEEVEELRREVAILKSKLNKKESSASRPGIRHRRQHQLRQTSSFQSPASGSLKTSPGDKLNKGKEPIVLDFFLPETTINDQIGTVDPNDAANQQAMPLAPADEASKQSAQSSDALGVDNLSLPELEK